MEPEEAESTVEESKPRKERRYPNMKGRVASVLSLFFWGFFITAIMIKGDYSAFPFLMLVLFFLLEALTVLRIFQEYKENGEWLEIQGP